jgi:ParB family chromosome partitioning protein
MSRRQIEAVSVSGVDVGDRKRGVDPSAVAGLKDSIERVGLRTPITVRTADDGARLVLVTGAHRLAAAKALSWETIDAFVEDEDDCDEIDAELWEIAENLHRAELTALERDEQVARWVVLTEQKLGQPAQVSGGRGKRGGLSEATRELGVERTDARRATKVASLSEQAKVTAREVGLDDNRTALLEASRKASAVEQVEFLKAQAERKSKERVNREVDRAISLTEAEQFAGWLAERIAPTERDTLIAWLEGTKAKDVIAALRRHHA